MPEKGCLRCIRVVDSHDERSTVYGNNDQGKNRFGVWRGDKRRRHQIKSNRIAPLQEVVAVTHPRTRHDNVIDRNNGINWMF